LKINKYYRKLTKMLHSICKKAFTALGKPSLHYMVCRVFRTIYEKLSEAVADEAKDLYQQRCSEISPNIRYCEYNIGDESAVEDLVQMRRQIGREDPLTSRLDVCLQLLSCRHFVCVRASLRVFTALHGMQTQSSDEHSVCPSVCLSVKRMICDKMEEISVLIFISYERSFSLIN